MEIQYKEIEELEQFSSDEIKDYQMYLEGCLKELLKSKEVVYQKKLDIERQAHELKTRLSKASTMIAELRIYIGFAKSMFWKKRDEEKESKHV